jgi:hypothetical protein
MPVRVRHVNVTMPGGKLTAAQGPLYWIYENETLTERRFRLESEDSEVIPETR